MLSGPTLSNYLCLYFVDLCQGCILFIEDFSLNKCPSSNGRKFYVSAPRSSPGRTGSLPSSSSSSSISDDKEKATTIIKRKMRELVVGESRPRYIYLKILLSVSSNFTLTQLHINFMIVYYKLEVIIQSFLQFLDQMI